jgi:hypothetical protein
MRVLKFNHQPISRADIRNVDLTRLLIMHDEFLPV